MTKPKLPSCCCEQFYAKNPHLKVLIRHSIL